MRMDEFLVPDVTMSVDETSLLQENENDFPDVPNKCDDASESQQSEMEKDEVQPDSGGLNNAEESNCVVEQELVNDKMEIDLPVELPNDVVESNDKVDDELNDKVDTNVDEKPNDQVDTNVDEKPNDQVDTNVDEKPNDKVDTNVDEEPKDDMATNLPEETNVNVKSNENVEPNNPEVAPEEDTTPKENEKVPEELNGKIAEEAEKIVAEINHNVSDVLSPEITSDVDKENTDAVPNNIEMKTSEFVTRLLIDAQIPDDYTQEELEEQIKMFGPSHQTVEFMRIHCTACNEHLGSAPDMQHRRYIHPLLRVIICKKCFDFYGSGDFDKDVDGSELYCRWCGQGGNVLCCAQCPYVFCKKCIRTNLGKRKLAQIKDIDDWTCFVCRPQEIRKLRIICKALYDYVQNKLLNPDPEQLKHDRSLCCHNKVKPFIATKHKNESDEDVDFLPKKKAKLEHLNNIAPVIWQSEVEDEVVCTPDLSLLMNDDEDEDILETPVDPLTSASPDCVVSDTSPQSTDEVKFISQTRVTRTVPILPKSNILAYKLSTPATSKPNSAIMPNLIQLQKPAITYVNASNESTNMLPNVNRINATIKTPPSSRLAPGLKYEWFDKAAQNTARINRNLSSRLCILSKQQITVTTLEGLANVHNSLQEILSTSVNNLMQIRKNLKNDFIAGLKKLKFCKLNEVNANNEISSVNLDDDDDVILVDNNTTNAAAKVTPTPVATPPEPEKSKGYLKVKPISELFEKKTDTPDPKSRSSPPPLTALKQLNGPTLPNNTGVTAITAIRKTIGPIRKTIGPNKKIGPIRKAVNPIKKPTVDFKQTGVKVDSLKFLTCGITNDTINAMLRVRVIVMKDFGKGTPKTHPLKSYVAFKLDENLNNGDLKINGGKVV